MNIAPVTMQVTEAASVASKQGGTPGTPGEFGKELSAGGPGGATGPQETAGQVGVFEERDALVKETMSLLQDYQTGKIKDQSLLMGKLLSIQMRAQDVSFRVELVSKVIEHGTSGTRTLMQTQA